MLVRNILPMHSFSVTLCPANQPMSTSSCNGLSIYPFFYPSHIFLALNAVLLFPSLSLFDEIQLTNRCNMPMTWNAEAEARLLLGILAQVRGALDYKALAAHMGPECSVMALRQHIFRLRRDAGIPASSPRKARVHPSEYTPKGSKQAASAGTPVSRVKRPYCFIDDDDEDKDSEKDVKPIIKDEDEKKNEEENDKELFFVDLVG
ncbi:hypothetical protein BDW60DRAFT_184667 [Aspergillus nidulans var. acristatus]